MKKVVCFGLCFLIVLCSFVISFADISYSDFPEPIIVPQSSDHSSSVGLFSTPSGALTYYFYSDNSPVYVILYSSENESSFKWLAFSESAGSHISRWYGDSDPVLTSTLSSEYNGYYFISGSLSKDSFVPNVTVYNVSSSSSASSIIDSVSSSVFSTTFDLTYLVDGSVSWLSTMAQAVKSSGLLLFMVLIGFVGIGIGLFRRFTNG